MPSRPNWISLFSTSVPGAFQTYAVATRIQSVIAASDNDIFAHRGLFGAVNINPIEVSEDAVILDQNTCGCPMELDAGINCFMC